MLERWLKRCNNDDAQADGNLPLQGQKGWTQFVPSAPFSLNDGGRQLFKRR